MDQLPSRAVEPEQTRRQLATKLQIENMEQVTAQQIVGIVSTKTSSHYVIHWHSYSSKNCTVKTLENWPRHFVDAHWHQNKRPSTATKRRRDDGIRLDGTWKTK